MKGQNVVSYTKGKKKSPHHLQHLFELNAQIHLHSVNSCLHIHAHCMLGNIPHSHRKYRHLKVQNTFSI